MAPVGRVRLGDPRRRTSISTEWDCDRGSPIDCRYIEGLPEEQEGDIRGCVLEIGKYAYTRQFGTTRVTRSHVFH